MCTLCQQNCHLLTNCFSRVRQAGQQVVQSLSRVAPALTSEALVRRMDEALNSVTSAHQAPSVLRSFAYAMKSILLVRRCGARFRLL